MFKESHASATTNNSIIVVREEPPSTMSNFDSVIRQNILRSIKKNYHGDSYEESALLPPTKSDENKKLIAAISENIIDVKRDLENFCQQLQEPSQKLLTFYLDDEQECEQTIFDDRFLNSEERELIALSACSRDLVLCGIPEIDLSTLTPDEKSLLNEHDKMSHIEERSLARKQSLETIRGIINDQASSALILRSYGQEHSTLFATATSHRDAKEKPKVEPW